MKKTFKRLGAVLLAAFMLLSTTICALADDNTQTSTPTTGNTITLNVSNVADGDTVYAYRLVEYNNDGNGYTFNDSFKLYIETEKKQSDVQAYLAGLDAAGVNELLEGYAAACKTGDTYSLPTASASEKATSSNTASLKLEAGYYLLLTETTGKNSHIYTPLSAFVKMDSENLAVYAGVSDTKLPEQEGAYTVSAKSAGGPTIDKKTNATKGAGKKQEWKGTAAAGVGETVRFYVKVNIPKYNDGTTLNLTVNDTLTNLEYTDKSVKVYSEEPQLSNTGVTTSDEKIITNAIKKTTIDNYQSDNGTQKLTFELDYAAIMDGATAEKSVYVYYEAIVKPEAVKNGKHEGTNVASLTYANASTPGSMHETDNVTTKVFDYYLKLNKVKDNTEEPLQGAKFSVYMNEGDDAIPFVKETDTDGTVYYRPAAKDETTDTVEVLEANFLIRGLDANTYYLEEVGTPKGYTKPKGRFKIVMTSNFDNGKHTGKLDSDKKQSYMEAVDPADKNLIFAGSGADTNPMHQFSATIKNFSTPNLPTTGGTGTVLLSIGGVVLMAAGAYLLFFRKKKEN